MDMFFTTCPPECSPVSRREAKEFASGVAATALTIFAVLAFVWLWRAARAKARAESEMFKLANGSIEEAPPRQF